jgi:hypothetical protein
MLAAADPLINQKVHYPGPEIRLIPPAFSLSRRIICQVEAVFNATAVSITRPDGRLDKIYHRQIALIRTY